MARFIFITGGVVSSLGKGLSSAALGALLQARGFRVRLRKLDPNLNVRENVEAWCEETEKSSDLPGLKHNRFLRIDRAQGLSVVASGGLWREDLDYV